MIRGRIARRRPVRKVNPKRKAKRYEVAFGAKADWIREMACGICFAPGPSDPHHVKTRGAGGTSADLVPLCRRCHGEGHAIGWTGFLVEMRMLAAELEARWHGKGH